MSKFGTKCQKIIKEKMHSVPQIYFPVSMTVPVDFAGFSSSEESREDHDLVRVARPSPRFLTTTMAEATPDDSRSLKYSIHKFSTFSSNYVPE